MQRDRRIVDILLPLLTAIVIGALAGLGAVFFRWLIHRLIELFDQVGGFWLTITPQAAWWWPMLLPALAGLIIGPVIVYLVPEIRGPGVPEVMEALALRGGHIRHRVTLFKTGATALCIAAGASVGREGPIVQIGASIGSNLSQLFRLDRDRVRMAVACGAAAGIAATFQAPMTGARFVMEILLREIEVVAMSNLVIAAVTGTWSAAPAGTAQPCSIPSFTMQHRPTCCSTWPWGCAAACSPGPDVDCFRLRRASSGKPPAPWSVPACGGAHRRPARPALAPGPGPRPPSARP